MALSFCFAKDMRGQPGWVGGQGSVREVGPLFAEGLSQKTGAGAEGLLVLGPRQGIWPFDGGFREKGRGFFEVCNGRRFVGEAQGIEAALAAGPDGAGGSLEGERGFARDVMAEKCVKIGGVEHGG